MVVVGPSLRHLRHRNTVTNYNNTSNLIVNQNATKPVKKDESLLKGNGNMKCEKKNLMSIDGNTIFDPEYGISSININGLSFNIGNKKIVSSNQIFKLEKDNFIPLMQVIRDYGNEYFFTKEAWDKSKYYILDEKKINRNDYYYGSNGRLRLGQEKEVKIKSIKVSYRLTYNGFVDIQTRRTQSIDMEIDFDSQEQYLDYKVYVLSDYKDSSLKKPNLYDIKEGNIYYYVGFGEVKINKLYDYPNVKNKFCNIVSIHNEKKSVDLNETCSYLYLLPYKKFNNPLSKLDESINELLLYPYVIKEGQTYNIFWRKIDDAAEYIVSVYKAIDRNGNYELYHAKDFTVDRNEKFLVVPNLVGKFIFKVSAEDRSGKVIAMSRGMIDGQPKYLGEE